MSGILNTNDYMTFLNDIKKDIQTFHILATLSVNREPILPYWRIGIEILKRKKEQGWYIQKTIKNSWP